MSESKYSVFRDPVMTGWVGHCGVFQKPMPPATLKLDKAAYEGSGLVGCVRTYPLSFDAMVAAGHEMDSGAHAAWERYVQEHGIRGEHDA